MDNKAVPSLMPVYRRYDLAFERGEGSWLYTTDGRRLLDFASGIAVTGLGHAHPHLVATVTEQAAKLWHVSNLFQIPELERLADRLVASTFADTVFVCNSGRGGDRGLHQDGPPPPLGDGATPSGTGSSPSRAPSTAAPWRPSRRPAARSWWRAWIRCCRASTSCRSATTTRCMPRSGPRPRPS